MIFHVTLEDGQTKRYEADELDSFNGQIVLVKKEKSGVTTYHRTVAWFNPMRIVSIATEETIKSGGTA